MMGNGGVARQIKRERQFISASGLDGAEIQHRRYQYDAVEADSLMLEKMIRQRRGARAAIEYERDRPRSSRLHRLLLVGDEKHLRLSLPGVILQNHVPGGGLVFDRVAIDGNLPVSDRKLVSRRLIRLMLIRRRIACGQLE